MKTKTIVTTTYVALDGREFTDKNACTAYEANILLKPGTVFSKSGSSTKIVIVTTYNHAHILFVGNDSAYRGYSNGLNPTGLYTPAEAIAYLQNGGWTLERSLPGTI